ncbi:MAG: family 10 glycosylhydrolase, partial [Proteobacteria bacterium]|nr:family 10 glycosylhydrolase [Pseudomonadota bacterium]
MRGVWVTPREGNALWTKGRIAAVMDSIAASGMNTVYFNAWSRGYPLWRSEVFESEAGLQTDPAAGSRDILQEAIAEAHRAGLELEAWMEYGYVAFWSGYNPAGIPQGPLFANHPDWLARDLLGGDEFILGGGLGYFHWMSHNHPEVHAFMVALHTEIARKYDIDGIELDRIRYPNLNCGYDSVSVERYKNDHGGIAPPTNTSDPGWMRWRADIINEFHAAVYDSIKSANPKIIVSNAPSHYGSGSSYPAYQSFLQDWKAWVNNGYVDAVQVQMYVSPTLLQTYIPSALSGINDTSKVMAGIAAVSSGTAYSFSDVLSMISVVRSAGLQGHSIWYYNDLQDLG